MRRLFAPLLIGLMFAPLVRAAPLDALAAAAAAALKSGDAVNADNLATQALAIGDLAPKDRARVLLNRGLARERLGRQSEALDDFTSAIQANTLPPSDQARAFFDRGVTHDEQGQTSEALADYSAALKLTPTFAPALNNRANVQRRLGKLDEAKRDYDASLAAGNNQPEFSLYGLGQIAEAQNDPAAAREWYSKAIAANPHYALASQRLALLGDAPAPVLKAPAVVASADTPIVLHPPPEKSDTGWTPPQDQPPSESSTKPLVLHMPERPAEKVAEAVPWPSIAPAAYAPPSDVPDLRPAIVERLAAPSKATAAEAKATPVAARVTASNVTQIQLGAWRAEDEAADGWNQIVARSGSLLDGLTPQIIATDIPGKGRYYRLRTSPASGTSAAALCGQLQRQGIACIAVK